MRIGIGFDIHRLISGRDLILGGVKLPSAKGLAGHSDSDVLLHALADALLGAAGAGDLGTFFPDTDPRWKNSPSRIFVKKALALAARGGWSVANVDLVVVAEAPRLGPHRQAVVRSVARLLSVPPGRVNLKAKTMEGLGDIGKGKAIASYAVALLEKKARSKR
jgi:2-C-methyl-D-erythritol 2,4-cyclodiphosphate synthase